MRMAGSTIRVSDATHEKLRELSHQLGEPISSLVARGTEMLRREHFLRSTNDAFARLRDDPSEWQAELEERAAWNGMLTDSEERS